MNNHTHTQRTISVTVYTNSVASCSSMGNKQHKPMVVKSNVVDFYSATICFMLQPRYVHDGFNDTNPPVPVTRKMGSLVQDEVQARFPAV